MGVLPGLGLGLGLSLGLGLGEPLEYHYSLVLSLVRQRPSMREMQGFALPIPGTAGKT
jgi:hypothetical protein